MRIGLTYDLIADHLAAGLDPEAAAEFDVPETIDAIAAALIRRGHAVERIGHVRALAARLVAGERWDLVFNIAEGLAGTGREAQVPALLDAYAIPYVFSEPLAMALTLDKAMAKRVVRDHGLATADFRLIADAADLDGFDLPFPCFVKPNAEGTGKGIDAKSLVQSLPELRERVAALTARFDQPVLAETFLPGREVTVGILGTGADARVIGVMEQVIYEDSLAPWYSHANKVADDWRDHMRYALADDDFGRAAGALALACHRALGCRDAGRVDIRADAAGRPCFIELNPLPGMRPGYSDLCVLSTMAGLGHDALIGGMLESALLRLPQEALVPA